MASYYFFTEVDLFTNQSSAQAFGPAPGFTNHKFCVTSKHTASSDPKAFSVCNGVVFVQEIPGTNNINLVLRPSQQPPFAFPKIKFFIYRNILKNTLINGAEIAAAFTNDLTQSIWASQTARNASTGVSDNPPKEALGIDISSNEEIEKVFFRDGVSFQFPVVNAGWHIGKFDKNGFGFEIITESVDYEPLLPTVRTAENIIEVTPLPGSPTPLQEFSHWTEKEKLLNYIDPSAFFGSFYNHKINCTKTTGNSVIEKNAVYDQLLKGGQFSGSDGIFFNRNKIYLDIRNEYNFSINYFKNYGTDIQAAYEDSGSLATLEYYANNWPIAVLENVFPSSVAGDSLTLRLALPDGSGDNPLPTIYLSVGSWKNNYPEEPKNKAKLIDLTVTSGLTNEITLGLPRHTALSSTTPVSSYIKLKYFKRFDLNSAPVPSSGTVIRAQHYLDNIFRPLAMKIFYAASNAVKTRFYDEEVFVDMKVDGDFDFVGKVGIADDDTNWTLTVIPVMIRSEDLNEFGLPLLQSEMSTAFPDYLSYLANKFSNKKVRKSNFDFTGTGPNVDYLEIINQEDDLPPTANENELGGITTIGFNKVNFQAIDVTAFQSHLPIFFATDNWEEGQDSLGQPYKSFDISLNGFTSNGTDVEVGKIVSNLKIYFYE